MCSFGAKDKDHAIMEFSPAHTAYQNVSRTGFRTFCKVDGEYWELFAENCDMHTGMSEVEITCQAGGLEASALYFGVPGERTAALARVLTVRNTGKKPVSLELLDGMPAVAPYGAEQDALKNSVDLTKSRTIVEDVDQGLACFRVRALMANDVEENQPEGCNFCLAWNGTGERLRPLVQPALVFGQNTSLVKPEGFLEMSLSELAELPQVTENQFPCCFWPEKAVLKPGEELKVFSLYGQTEDRNRVPVLADRVDGGKWFEGKRREAAALVEELCAPIATKTGDPVFDAYCRRSYLDNILQGGAPIFFRSEGKETPFYLYSREHGAPDQEYAYFAPDEPYYAQGSGNFRDINQSRRCGVRFTPEIKAEDIYTFYDLIQPNGYNPLTVGPTLYKLPAVRLKDVLDQLPPDRYEDGLRLLSQPFTPGALAVALEDWGLDARELTASIVCASASEPNASFQEGYWCDHWTYNLDLIENYLSIYPERQEELLFGEDRYRWYAPKALITPRVKRYRVTPNGLRQYNSLDTESMTEEKDNWVHTDEGEEAHSILMGKLLMLCALKVATLDAAGMGVEMVGGKPGSYDALDGLPQLLGSSMAESCELARLLHFTIGAVEQHGDDIAVYQEVGGLFLRIFDILQRESDHFARWDKMSQARETYRTQIGGGFHGQRVALHCNQVTEMLKGMEEAVLDGIQRAVELGGGICPTYLIFEATGITETPDGPMPTGLIPHPLPLFLEGPAHWLKLDFSQEEKAELVRKVKESALYDRELNMYKVSESLASVSQEAGRALLYTPGWLKNESIWLHMEYKYLLELLKSGLYEQFNEAFRAAAVPFQDPERYGRGPLENVSFLASSANPDPAVWGRGYMAGFSGASAEFLQIWQLMFFGPEPFHWEYDELYMSFHPFIPDYLMPQDGVIESVFLGKIKVVYHVSGLSRLVPGETAPVFWELTDLRGEKMSIEGMFLPDGEANAVRAGQISEIHVTMQ